MKNHKFWAKSEMFEEESTITQYFEDDDDEIRDFIVKCI
jgi:hypothetical protein